MTQLSLSGSLVNWIICKHTHNGEMAEWSKALVSKTSVSANPSTGSSNLPLSSILKGSMKTLRSRMCRCGIKLLLKIEIEEGKITGWETYVAVPDDGISKTSVTSMIGRRSSRRIRTWSLGLAYLYCRACQAKVQVRTFDTLEEYLDKK